MNSFTPLLLLVSATLAACNDGTDASTRASSLESEQSFHPGQFGFYTSSRDTYFKTDPSVQGSALADDKRCYIKEGGVKFRVVPRGSRYQDAEGFVRVFLFSVSDASKTDGKACGSAKGTDGYLFIDHLVIDTEGAKFEPENKAEAKAFREIHQSSNLVE